MSASTEVAMSLGDNGTGLLEQLRSPSEGNVLCAVRAVSRLAWDGRGTLTSFVAPLLALMDHESAAVRTTAASALAVLTDGNHEIAALLGSEDSLRNLVDRLGSPVPGMPWRVAAIVGRLLASSVELEKAIIDAGGLESLAALLESGDVYAQAKAATVLGTVAAGGRRAQVLALGCGKIVLSSEGHGLVTSFNSDVRLAACRLLALLLDDDSELRQSVGTAMGVEILIGTGRIPSEGGTRDVGLVSDGGDTAMWAATALQSIMEVGPNGEQPDGARHVIAAGGPETLIAIFHSGFPSATLCAAAGALASLGCSGVEAHNSVLRSRVSRELVELTHLQQFGTAVRKQALVSLCRLSAVSAEFRAQLVEAGGAETVVSAVAVDDTRGAALSLVASLVQDPAATSAVTAGGFFRCVAIVLRAILRNETTMQHAGEVDDLALALTRLVESDVSGNIQALCGQEGIVDTLSLMIGMKMPTSALVRVLAALHVLATENVRIQNAIMDHHGLNWILMNGLTSADALVSRASAAALLGFSRAPAAVQSRLLQLLLELIESERGHNRGMQMLCDLTLRLDLGTFWNSSIGGLSRFRRAAKKVMAMNRWKFQIRGTPVPLYGRLDMPDSTGATANSDPSTAAEVGSDSEASKCAPSGAAPEATTTPTKDEYAAAAMKILLECDAHDDRVLGVVLAWLPEHARIFLKVLKALDTISLCGLHLKLQVSSQSTGTLVKRAAEVIVAEVRVNSSKQSERHAVQSICGCLNRAGCRRSKLVQSAAIAALEILATDTELARVVVDSGALTSLLDLQNVSLEAYRCDTRGDIATHARLALTSIFSHVDLAHISAPLVCAELRSLLDANTPAHQVPGPRVNAVFAVRDLKLLQRTEVTRDAAVAEFSSSDTTIKKLIEIVKTVPGKEFQESTIEYVRASLDSECGTYLSSVARICLLRMTRPCCVRSFI